jgi:DNA-binding NarL/FixJ family response regulator
VSRPVRIQVVDNHESVLLSVETLASRHPAELELVSAHTALEQLDLDAAPPDVLVLDLYLGRDDVPTTPRIPALVAWPTRVLVYTSAEFPVPVRQAVAAGAAGLSLKSDPLDSLRSAVLDVADGGFACSSTVAHALLTDPDLVVALTERELDVVRGLEDGLTQRQIGRRLGIAEDTVKDHLKAARVKMQRHGREVSNAHSIVREARRDGWLDG